jgi:O-antigen/teichoic acid export membrane protein
MTTDIAREHIRGSSLLLTGRLLTLGVTFLAQVLTVRYLSKGDYGAWTYALSAATLLQSLVALGLDRAITRFVPIYRERCEYDKLIGVVLLVVGVTLCSSVVLIGAVLGFPDLLARIARVEPKSLTLMSVMVFLVPLTAIDALLVALFACLGRAGAIFFRGYVLAPVLKLVVVLILVFLKADVIVLAYGYLAANLIGLLINVQQLVRAVDEEGLRQPFADSGITFPTREALAFTMPLLTADAAMAVMETCGALVLGFFHGPEEVAVFTAAVPLAAMNQVVMRNFTLLYTPAASRLFAHEDYAAINDLYWRTAVWIAILTLPVFAVTFCASGSITSLLYGGRYQQTGVILAMLSLGEYVNAALGFNGLTLRVLNKVKYVVIINVASAVVALVTNLLLVPHYGPLGAAIATSSTMIVHNTLKQLALRQSAGISLFDPRYAGLYASVATCAIGLMVMQWMLPAHPMVMVSMATMGSLVTLLVCKRALMVSEVFPEVLKVPVLRALLA